MIVLFSAQLNGLCLENHISPLMLPGHLGLLCDISKFKMSSFAFRWRKRHFNRRISNEGYKCTTCISVFPKGPPIKEDKGRVYLVTFYLKVQTIEAHGNKGMRNTHIHTHLQTAYVSSRNDSPTAAIVHLHKGTYQMFFYDSFTFGMSRAICCSKPLTFYMPYGPRFNLSLPAPASFTFPMLIQHLTFT